MRLGGARVTDGDWAGTKAPGRAEPPASGARRRRGRGQSRGAGPIAADGGDGVVQRTVEGVAGEARESQVASPPVAPVNRRGVQQGQRAATVEQHVGADHVGAVHEAPGPGSAEDVVFAQRIPEQVGGVQSQALSPDQNAPPGEGECALAQRHLRIGLVHLRLGPGRAVDGETQLGPEGQCVGSDGEPQSGRRALVGVAEARSRGGRNQIGAPAHRGRLRIGVDRAARLEGDFFRLARVAQRGKRQRDRRLDQ